MENLDFLDDLGELALGSRLKRLSDRMIGDASQIYGQADVLFESRWFPLFALLIRQGPHSVGDACVRLGISQPAVSRFAKELVAAGLVEYTDDPKDGRRKVMSLSAEGRRTAEAIAPLWRAVDHAARDLCAETGVDMYGAVRRLEESLAERSLTQRAQHHLRNPKVRMVPYRTELRAYFRDINLEWVREMFTVEETDKRVFDDPETYILAPGGRIWFAEHTTLGVVGTCALQFTGPGEVELTKMGVLKTARGLKIGDRLLQHVIKDAYLAGASTLYLLTNARCEAAIHLYRKHGFVDSSEIMQRYGRKYQRCNVAMEHRSPRTP